MYAVSQPATWKSSEEVREKEEARERREMVVPPVNSLRFFLNEERGCSHDSGEKLKSRVKRVGVAFLEIYYKKEFLETGVKSLYFLA